jgi:hypothetical protein
MIGCLNDFLDSDSPAARRLPSNGPSQYIQWELAKCVTTAGPKARAVFIAPPVNGT